MSALTEPVPEFSRPVAADSLGAQARTYVIEANAAECAALARRFKILGIGRIRAELRLESVAGSTLIDLSGHIDAEVTQACVVSMEPVVQTVSEDFSISYGPESAIEPDAISIEIDDAEPPEPIIGGSIDMGEAVAQYLALALDPFPRAPGVAFEGIQDSPAPVPSNPFAALATLKRK